MSDIHSILKSAAENKVLGEALTKQIDIVVSTKNIKKDQVINALAQGTGVTRGTIVQIMKGKIKNPPVKRLEDFSITFNKLSS